MDKIVFPFRSPTHLALTHVIADSEVWRKYGLDVDYERHISSSDAHVALANGDVQFVDGNHVSTYGKRARGDRWVYLGQTLNTLPGRKLVVRADSGINTIADLRHKTVGTIGHHPGLNTWLELKRHGLDVDRDDVSIVYQYAPAFMKGMKPDGVMRHIQPGSKSETHTVHKAGEVDPPLWHWVRDGQVDATFLWPPGTGFAQRAGLKLIDLEPMPMIHYTTLSTNLRFVEEQPDIVERFTKAFIEGIHYFKTNPERAISVIQDRYTFEGPLDRELATAMYRSIADSIEPNLMPRMDAIANVYIEGVRDDKDAATVNPLELWDTHFIRKLIDAGFINDLYQVR